MPPTVRRKPEIMSMPVGTPFWASVLEGARPEGRPYKAGHRAWRPLPLLILCLLVGCIPARDVPPQLEATAAPAYQFIGETLQTDLYTVTPPEGWRLISGPGQDPYTFQFVNPDNTALIVLSDHVLTSDSLPIPAGLSITRDEATTAVQSAAMGTGTTIYAGAISHPDSADLLVMVLGQIIESLR